MNNLRIGDVVFLHSGFHKNLGKQLINSHHRFIVVDDGVVCPVSSNTKWVSNKYPYNIMINDYKVANFTKPSYVDTSTRGEIEDKDVQKIVGHVSDSDLKNIYRGYLKYDIRNILEQTQMVLDFYKKGYNKS